MSRLNLGAIALLWSVLASGVGLAAETSRIQRKPPDAAEAERIASEMATNDSLLQKRDVVVTDRGFFVRGLAGDGYAYEFSSVPNPVPTSVGGR
jgi:hypothetical protein